MLIRSDMTPQTSPLFGVDAMEPAQTDGSRQQAGWFRLSFDHDRWEWSAPVARMHGYAPGEVLPDANLVLSHQHPDDRRQVGATIDEIRRTSQALSSRHRIVDAHGRTHQVVLIGEPVTDQLGAVTGVQGFYVEVTSARDPARERSVTDAVAEITAARAGIEQAKGMLMMVYRIDAEAAFELLKWRSQATNTKVRALSERVAADFLAVDSDTTRNARSEYDHLLLTAHLRVASGA